MITKSKKILQKIILFLIIFSMLITLFIVPVYADTTDTENINEIGDEENFESYKINGSESEYAKFGCKISIEIDFTPNFDLSNLNLSFYNKDTNTYYTDTIYYNMYVIKDSYVNKRTYYVNYCLPAGDYEITCETSNIATYFVYIDKRIYNEATQVYHLEDGTNFKLLAYEKSDGESISDKQTYLEKFDIKWSNIKKNEFTDKDEVGNKIVNDIPTPDSTENTEQISEIDNNTNSKMTIKDIILLILGIIFIIFVIIRYIKIKKIS